MIDLDGTDRIPANRQALPVSQFIEITAVATYDDSQALNFWLCH